MSTSEQPNEGGQALAPYYVDDAVTIYHGDTLEVLERLSMETAEGSVDAILTDPPYASGARHESDKASRSEGMLRGQRFAKPIDNDRLTTTGFIWLLRGAVLRSYDLLKDGASVLSFIDWRSWPNLVGALETCNLRVQGQVVWDKSKLGMGNGFRNQHELVCHASKGVPVVYERNVPTVLRHPSIDSSVADHPSPKPEPLVRDLLRCVTPPGGLVLDPFMGTGRPLRAAKDMGRRVIGIEKDEAYCEAAARRLGQETLDFGGAA